MCPVEITYSDNSKSTIGPQSGSVTRNGIEVNWTGDEYRGYGVLNNGIRIDSGQLATDNPIAIEVSTRYVAPIEKYQPATKIVDRIKLRYTK
ncbi:MAG: hypothetical protein HQK53_17245 [Oligoflexia bacterium]|nr:hypothetical protein [Oligoflexia bacterium]